MSPEPGIARMKRLTVSGDQYLGALAGAVASLGTALVAVKFSSRPVALLAAVPALVFIAYTAAGSVSAIVGILRETVLPVLRDIWGGLRGGVRQR